MNCNSKLPFFSIGDAAAAMLSRKGNANKNIANVAPPGTNHKKSKHMVNKLAYLCDEEFSKRVSDATPPQINNKKTKRDESAKS